MKQFRRHFHIIMKKSYIPLFVLLLTICFGSILYTYYFLINTNAKANVNNIEEIPSVSNENDIPQPNKAKKIRQPSNTQPKHRYSDLIIDPETDDEDDCYDRSENRLELLAPFGLNPKTHFPGKPYVLVLGSGGLIGSELESILTKQGYNTLHILSRHHLDLRLNHSLDIFDDINITFVFFLAYEVGGAKFLQLPEHQQQILDNNIKITDNVFSWLKKRQIRYAFASSSLSADKSNYGYVKRLGENITLEMPHLGRVFRLWNAYGFEYPGPKSHAIPDFVFQCLQYKKIRMLTTGEELRQFSHVIDISNALIAIMEHFEETPHEVDISNGNWITLKAVAEAVQKAVPGCQLEIPEKKAKVQKRHEANIFTDWHKNIWQEKLTLDEGISNIVEHMQDYINRAKNGSGVTFIINCGETVDSQIIKNVEFIVKKIDEMNSPLEPMKVEIIAAAKSISMDLYSSNETKLPCLFLINKGGKYLHKAVKFAHSDPIVIMDHNVLPTMNHMHFFQREIPRDLIFYFSEKYHVDSIDDIEKETIPGLASIQIINDCSKSDYIKPNDLSFIVATKETWLSIKVPPDDVNVHDWLMRFKCGYLSIKFESPVWNWGENEDKVQPQQEKACCTGHVKSNAQKSDSYIHYGERNLIR